MRRTQLIVAWVLLFGLTAGSAYYGLREVDARTTLRATANGTTGITPIGQPTPPEALPPTGSTAPAAGSIAPDGVSPSAPPLVSVPADGHGATDTGPALGANPGSREKRAVPQRGEPAAPGAATRSDATAAEETADLAALEERYDGLYADADDVIRFYEEMERTLEQQSPKQSLRGEVRTEWNRMVSALERARTAIDAGRVQDATRALDAAERSLTFLDQFRDRPRR